MYRALDCFTNRVEYLINGASSYDLNHTLAIVVSKHIGALVVVLIPPAYQVFRVARQTLESSCLRLILRWGDLYVE